jgi:DnaK suppressor protein
MLSKKKKEYFKKLLIHRLNDLFEETDSPIRDLHELNDESLDFADQAAVTANMDFALHIKERENKLVLKIQEALERLQNGTFGICDECGEEISEQRLRARPIATLCIMCKREEEAKEKLRGA